MQNLRESFNPIQLHYISWWKCIEAIPLMHWEVKSKIQKSIQTQKVIHMMLEMTWNFDTTNIYFQHLTLSDMAPGRYAPAYGRGGT